MNWFKRLFSGSDASTPAESVPPLPPSRRTEDERPKSKKARSYSASGVAKKFARHVPGAVLEDFSARGRPDGMQVRVTYTQQGITARVVIYRVDGEFAMWLETRCPGVFGSFDILHGVPANDDPDLRERVYLASERFLFGPRVRNEVARVRMLAPATQRRLLALSDKVVVVKLAEEVFSLRIGDLEEFADRQASSGNGALEIVALGVEAASIVREFSPLARDVADWAEVRTCGFCHASFVFSPEAPVCANCGAPAESAALLPPPLEEEIPDNPIVPEEDLDPGERVELMTAIVAMARAFAARVDHPSLREDPERVRVFVEYEIDGRAYRAKFMEESVGVRTRAPGVKGDFFLRWDDNDPGGEDDNAAAWTESERRIFFSEHCRVCSEHTTREARRLASLPAEARALLVRRCEEHSAPAQLEDEYVALGLGHAAHERGVQVIVEATRDLGRIADAFPRDWDPRGGPEDVVRFQLKSCRYCGWAYFLEAGATACTHCGAPSA